MGRFDPPEKVFLVDFALGWDQFFGFKIAWAFKQPDLFSSDDLFISDFGCQRLMGRRFDFGC